MKVRIEIDTKTFVRFWLVVIGFALGLVIMYSARSALIIIATSIFLAIALSPPVKRLASFLPGRSRLGGTALAYVAVVAVLAGFVFLVVPPVIEQTAKFAQGIPGFVEDVTSRWGALDNVINRYGLEEQVNGALESIRENASAWASNIGSTIITGAGSLISLGAAVLITLFMTFFMVVEGPAWAERLWSVYRNKSMMKHHRDVATKMYNVVTSYVNGQLLIALIAATLAGLFVFVLSLFFDLPANLAIPTVAIVFTGSLIPMFGATVAGVLTSLLLAFNDVTAAVVYAVYFIVYQQVENNLITTVIQSKTLDLSPLVVLIAVTIGTYLFGIAGGIISIPIAGCIQVLIKDYLQHRNATPESPSTLKKIASKIARES